MMILKTKTVFLSFRCGTCDEVFTSQMALDRHQEEKEHWSDDDDDDDDVEDTDDEEDDDEENQEDEITSDDSQLDTEDEMELEGNSGRQKGYSTQAHQLKKERSFLL